MSKKTPIFAVLDGHAIIHRAWHALPPTLATKDGRVVNAVYGFTSMLLKILKDIKPDYIAVAFDLPKPTFRHEKFKAYKAQRVKQPDIFYEQIPIIKDVVRSFNIKIFECPGFEADDVIATLVKHPSVEKIKSVVVTGDMDTLQLVDENTVVYAANRGLADTITYTPDEVRRKYDGLSPNQVVDYKALRGDPSDNIPGVKGIGEKTAIALLNEFKTVENLYANIDSPKIKDRYRELLKQYRDDALLSKELCQIQENAPIDFDIQATKVGGFSLTAVVAMFQQLEFKSLLSKIPKDLAINDSPQQSLFGDSANKTQPGDKQANTNHRYTTVTDIKTLEDVITAIKHAGKVVIDTETTSTDPLQSTLLGVSLCYKEAEAYYIPVAKHVAATTGKKLLKAIAPILEDETIKKAGHNIKFDIHALHHAGITVRGTWFDTMIASYICNPGTRQHNLDALVFTELGYQMEPITDLIGTGKNQTTLAEVALERVSRYSCEDADYTWRLIEPLTQELKEKNNLGLFETIEMPLVDVLASIEQNGILLDTELLRKMSRIMNKKIAELTNTIHKLAGEEFNVSSPLQLKKILFEKLRIDTAGLGRTKTGISTAAEELEKLKGKHEIIDHILEYRELTKLTSTYIDALPQLVHKKDGRVHTSFNQTIAATGRLSSSEPNLQNIPIRTDVGQEIRKAFIAAPGYKLISADYSQIELRVIASLANDPKMIDSFIRNEDIHARTAAEINQVPIEQVTKQMRYAAKAINFGIIYGQGPWGLAASAGISFQEAQDFIDRYFAIYQPIRDYLERTKEVARQHGYVETWFGRRRYLPEINSSAPGVRAAAERMAINHPIQGTAADLMKLAMIAVHQHLPALSPKSKILLQVHDELVLEVPEKEVIAVAALVRKHMEGVYQLRAPVQTEVEVGDTWGNMDVIPR